MSYKVMRAKQARQRYFQWVVSQPDFWRMEITIDDDFHVYINGERWDGRRWILKGI